MILIAEEIFRKKANQQSGVHNTS